MPAPTVTAVSASKGFTTGSTVVTIVGTNFSNPVTVTFGGVAASAASAVGGAGTRVQATTPAHAVGVVDVAVTTGAGTGTGVGVFTYIAAPSPSYSLVLWDDSCHAFISDDTGNSFVQGATPGKSGVTPAPNDSGLDPHGFGTLKDGWSDGAMAINDADYVTFVGADSDYNDVTFSGIIGLSINRGNNLTFTLFDPSPGGTGFNPGDGTNSIEISRIAMSANGQTILPTVDFSDTNPPADFYQRISRNGGSTWNDVTGLDKNVYFSFVCFGSTASGYMYAKPQAGGTRGLNPAYIRKSTDWGVTWTALTSGPDYQGNIEGEGAQRLRCSADGQTVVHIEYTGHLSVSKNAGASWTVFNFPVLFSFSVIGNFSDCAVTPDGNTIIAVLQKFSGGNNTPAVFVSTDGGTTFSDKTAGIQLPATTLNPGAGQCNVAPDGLGMVVTFQNYNDPGIVYPDGVTGFMVYANVSTDAGVTWRLCSFGADPYETGSVIGIFTAAYITPPPPAPPAGMSRRFEALIGPIHAAAGT